MSGLLEKISAPFKRNAHFLVVEDKPNWQQHISNVVKDVFGQRSKIHLASDAIEAITILDQLKATKGKVRAILTDLHMSDDGKANGDVLLTNLMMRVRAGGYTPPPVAVVSGTFMDAQKKEIGELIPGVPMFDKGAFRPTAVGTSQRGALEENLRQLVNRQFGALTYNSEAIKSLKSKKAELSNASEMGAFIDEVSGWVGTVWNEFGEFLSRIDGHEFFKDCSLYDEGRFTGMELHDFKNDLPGFVDTVKNSGDAPDGLLEELESLRVYISRGLNIVRDAEQSKTIDIGALVQDTVFSFRTDGKLSFDNPDGVDLEVPLDSRAFQLMFIEVLRNALRYSGDGEVNISIDGFALTVSNNYQGELPFKIQNGEITEGSLPECSKSPLGSSFGITSLMKTANELGIGFNMQKEDGIVTVQLDFTQLLSKPESEQDSSESDEDRENVPNFKNVVFMCHENPNHPEATFRSSIKNMPLDFDSHCVNFDLDCDSKDEVEEWIAANSETFATACLLVIHTRDVSHFYNVLSPLVRRYPQLVILPAGSYGTTGAFYSSLRVDSQSLKLAVKLGDEDELEYYASLGNVMWRDDPDVAASSLEGNNFCTKTYKEEDWHKILDVALNRAVDSVKG